MGIYDREYYRTETSGSLWLTGQTPVVFALLVANVGVFAAQMFDSTGRVTAMFLLSAGALFEDFQVWRLVTAAFCHSTGSLWHIIGNMLFLWWFGRELEKLYGSREFLAFYLSAAVFSSLAWVVTDWLAGTQHAMIGASGAVTAVTVLYTLYNPRHRIYIYGIIPVEMRWMVLLYLAVDAYGLIARGGYSPIAHMAHLGGAGYAVLFKYADLRASRLFSGRFRRPGRTKLRVVSADPEPAGVAALDEVLEHRMDEVLAKLAREGPESLSEQERSVLDQASRRLREKRG